MELLDHHLGRTAVSIGVLFVITWIVSLWRRDSSLVDRIWGVGFVIAALVTAHHTTLSNPRQWLMLTMVGLWGLRLSAFLTWRNWGEGEDPRYQAMRRQHQHRFWWVSLVTVFALQAIIQWLLSIPLQLTIAETHGTPLGVWDLLGITLFLTGFIVETTADQQLTHFRRTATPGAVMDRGLWRYSRHPNYFGEAVLWWGFYGVTCAVPNGFWTFPAPLIMTLLLLKVSGIPMLEKRLKKRREGYAAYIERTSAFIPWPPKSTDQTSKRPLA
jgi:steroid 5-alpha reductase family enzyme